MEKPVEVSVLCITYNHGDMLRQALDSMVRQKTDFGIEILVHDDCSTDGTTDILREYAGKYPYIIRPFYETENQYEKGIDYFRMMARHARGKYLAICEGDDYWCDEDKLQMQYDALETNPGVDLCACAAGMFDREGTKQTGLIRPKRCSGIISIEDVIYGGGQYFPTASLFLRKEEFHRKMYDFEKVISCDYTMQIKGAMRGGAFYIDRVMVNYRTRVPESWKDIGKSMPEYEKSNFYRKLVAMLKVLDKEMNGKYHSVIMERLKISEHADISFYDQLCSHGDSLLHALEHCPAIYLWGNGKRGDALQQYCVDKGICLTGVCDQSNTNIGENTRYGFKIVSTGEVEKGKGLIIAANEAIYKELKYLENDCKLENLQKYIPWS